MARLKETTKSNAPGKGRRRGLRKAHGYAEEYEISSDELSSPKETSQQNIADEITVRTTHAPSHNSSRPSTANSGTASERSRRRGASSLVNEEDIDMLNAINSIEADEPAGEGPALKKPKSAIKDTASSSRKGRSKYDNPDEMLTNPRAPLATTNLRDLLCSPKAWDLLNPEEQQKVLSLFPDKKEIVDADTDQARPDVTALRNNDNFRHDAARYQDALAKGWHDPEWIRQAQQAHMKRSCGAYDEYLAARFKDDWGIRHDDEIIIAGLWNTPVPKSDGGSDDGDVQEEEEGKHSSQAILEQEGDGAKEVEEDERAPERMEGLESTTTASIENASIP